MYTYFYIAIFMNSLLDEKRMLAWNDGAYT